MKTDTTLNNIVTESSPLENQPQDNFHTINWQYKAKIFITCLVSAVTANQEMQIGYYVLRAKK